MLDCCFQMVIILYRNQSTALPPKNLFDFENPEKSRSLSAIAIDLYDSLWISNDKLERELVSAYAGIFVQENNDRSPERKHHLEFGQFERELQKAYARLKKASLNAIPYSCPSSLSAYV